jgi:myo-inositol-1(or 4)-monophosphatase
MGSVAAKMGLVAAGLSDATWTLVPKHEWDVAGGTALVRAAGGDVWRLDGSSPRFNQPHPKFDGLFAAAAGLREPIERYFEGA